MSDSRQFTNRETAEAMGRQARELVPWWAKAAQAVEITFPNASTRRDVRHGLGVVPDGAIVLVAGPGQVEAVDVHLWTSDLAFFQATTANCRATQSPDTFGFMLVPASP